MENVISYNPYLLPVNPVLNLNKIFTTDTTDFTDKITDFYFCDNQCITRGLREISG